MEIQLFTILLYFFISTAVLPPSTTATIAVPPTAGDALPPASGETEYIRSSCSSTRYPDTCFATLSNYSTTVHHDPARLALIAIHVALSNATNMTHYVHNITQQFTHQAAYSVKEYAAIQDCVSVFEDAVDEIHQSRGEMRHLGWTGESLRFQLSNVQTWMSAALTNEDTCLDGFEEVTSGGVKTDVCDRVAAVMQVTSNALALVNRYADTVPG